MALRWIGWVCCIGLSSAFPLHTRQSSTSNSHSAKIIAPVVIVAVVCAMLVGFGWWKRRKRTQELIQQLQTPATNNNANSTNNATTQTTPATGADAPARPPRRRRRRRPSQISTKSLPAYNEQAGDEEIVLVRRAQRQSDSDEDDENEDNGRRSTQAAPSNAPDSRPLLDDDSSPDMPRVSLASSTRGRSLDHPDQPSQSRAQSQLGHESIAPTTIASSIADTEPEPDATATAQPHPEIPSYTEAMSTSHVNLPSTTEHTTEPSSSTATDMGPAPADADATVRPKRKSVFRHLGRFNISKPSGSTTPANETVEMTASPRLSTSTHRPSNSLSTTNTHKPSPSLSSLSLILTRSQSPTMSRTSLNISAPISTTLVRTELSYPRAGPTPEQIRFLSSRESLGRFGMPYGEQAIAAAKSRDYLPPIYQPRTDAGPSGSGNTTAGNSTAQEEEPTIRRGPILLTPGELAQQQKSENAVVSGRPENDRPDLDPTMAIQEEPIQSMAVEEEDSKSIQHESGAISEEPASISVERATISEEPERIRDEPMTEQESRGTQYGEVDVQVEPRARRESPYDDLNDGRRESVMTTNSFVTATEGQDSSPPTPTAETYQSQVPTVQVQQTASQSQAPGPRAQTVLIPQSHEALHPELTLVPATPIG